MRAKLPSKGELAFLALCDWCSTHGFTIPIPEHYFAKPRRWRWDACWPVEKVAVEFQGGIWQKGGGFHTKPRHYEDDLEKFSEGAIRGWRLLVVSYEQFNNGLLWDYIERIFPLPESSDD